MQRLHRIIFHVKMLGFRLPQVRAGCFHITLRNREIAKTPRGILGKFKSKWGHKVSAGRSFSLNATVSPCVCFKERGSMYALCHWKHVTGPNGETMGVGEPSWPWGFPFAAFREQAHRPTGPLNGLIPAPLFSLEKQQIISVH